MTESLSDKYLGLPALVGADRSDCFRHLVDRVVTRIDGWKEKTLSMGGKETLIKSIAQAVPVYAMMVVKILGKSAKELQVPSHSTGGGMIMIIRESIGKNGGRCVCQRIRVAWASGIYSLSTWLCLQSRFGGCYVIQILYVLECSKLDTIRMVNC